LEILRSTLFSLSWIVFGATLVVTGLLVLRVILNWLGVNPFGRIAYNLTRITEPMVRPMRHQMGGRAMRYDLLPLVVGIMVLVTGLFISSVIWQLGKILYAIGANLTSGSVSSGPMIGELIRLVGLIYVAAIFLRFFLPFFGTGYGNKLFRFIFTITEPVLKPLRRIFMMGMVDFSPLIAMFIIQILTNVLASAVGG
jgi:YggT family protein